MSKINDVDGKTYPEEQLANADLRNIQPVINQSNELTRRSQDLTSINRYYGGGDGFEIPEEMEENGQTLRTLVQELQANINQTLQQSSWGIIREQLIGSLNGIKADEQIRLVIRTDESTVQSLPLERTKFIVDMLMQSHPLISVVFAPVTVSRQMLNRKLVWSGTPKVLLVLGNQKDIKEKIEEDEIKKHFHQTSAIVKTLSKPSITDLLKTIADEEFDVIIIVAHSLKNDDGNDGIIKINDTETITIDHWKDPFRRSVEKKLKLVILAGCSSIGLARYLSSATVGVPNVIAFRMPVHYEIVRLFFDRLLSKWIKGASLEIALTETRGDLPSKEPDCPGASMLPILISSPYALPLMFPKNNSILVKTSSQIEKFFKSKNKQKYLLLFLTGLAIAICLYIFLQMQLKVCNSTIGDNISCGEEILNTETIVSDQPDKEAGASTIKAGDYPTAVKLLTKAWKEKQDPETLIMLENSKLRTQNFPIKSIALSIPGTHKTPPDISMAMLKAVAYAQQQWNADPIHRWRLQLVLADDKNNKSTAPELAKNVIDRGILATIGSYSSAVTLPAKDIYQQNKTVLLSGTSTATTLINQSSDTFFFRVCSNNTVAGKNIANYLKANKYTNIALFHTTGQPFSDSMTAALRENSSGLNIVKDFDFKGQDAAINLLTQAKQAGAQAIVLIPDAYTSNDPERLRLLSIIKENNGMLPIIGNEVIKDQTLFNYSKQQIERVVISLTWDPSNLSTKAIETPGFWGDPSQLDHRLAMNYDAAQVLIKALDLLPDNQSIVDSRKQIQKTLSDPNFSINGITGKISFTGSERSDQSSSLVTPQCDSGTCKGFKPVTIK